MRARSWRLVRQLIFLTLFLNLSGSLVHARAFLACSDLALLFSELRVDAAVELEMNMNPAVMRILTTQDGMLGSVLGKLETPDWVKSLAQTKSVENPRELDWDSLDYGQKLALLQYVSTNRGVGFFQDRKIHGMKIREKIQMTFDGPTDFLGQTYPPGSHRIDVSSVLAGPVEYRGPAEVDQVSGVELHFRGRRNAGDLSLNAWTFQKGIGAPATHQHVHMVSALPMAELKAHPEQQAALMGDYFRRVNLYSEIVGIFSGYHLKRSAKGTVVFFDNLQPSTLQGVTNYFLDIGRGQQPKIGDRFKMAWVGMRGSDKYDTPGLWGLEYRRINPSDHPDALQQTLDAIQTQMNNNQYGMSPERISQWLEENPEGKVPAFAVSGSWYNKDNYRVFTLAPTEVKQLVDEDFKKLLLDRFEETKELKMLLHDWSKDPMFFDQPGYQQLIREQQVLALAKIKQLTSTQLSDEKSKISDIMQNFLWDSGIAKATARSLGIDAQLLSTSQPGVIGKPRAAAPETISRDASQAQ